MEYQTIKENGKVKFVVLPIESFRALLDQLEDKSDLQAIREANSEPLYDQEEAESYIFMNPVKKDRHLHHMKNRAQKKEESRPRRVGDNPARNHLSCDGGVFFS